MSHRRGISGVDAGDHDDADDAHDVSERFWQSLTKGTREALTRASQVTRPDDPDSNATALPGGASTSNGPQGRCTFAWDGRVVDLAALRYRLVEALWSLEQGRERHECDEGDVIEYVWAEDDWDAYEGRLNDLCYQVRKVFRDAEIPLTICRKGGKIWLEVPE